MASGVCISGFFHAAEDETSYFIQSLENTVITVSFHGMICYICTTIDE